MHDVTLSSANMSASATADLSHSTGSMIKKGMAEPVPDIQSLGTGFGESTEFSTTTVNFERGDLGAMVVLYYDDARGLKARGIQLVKPSKARLSNQPQAFPGMNCQPPPGWKG